MANGWRTAGNILGTAGAGAAAGAAIHPVYGSAVGAGLGLVTGIFQGLADSKDESAKRKVLNQLADQIGTTYDRIERDYDTFYKMYTPGGTYEDALIAAQMIRDFDPDSFDLYADLDADGDGKVSIEEYSPDYDKEVTDFLNPYMDEVIDASNRKVTASAAGAGLGRSTGTAQKIARNTAEEYDKLYNTALDAWEADRDFTYRKFSDYNSAMQNRLNSLMNAQQWKIGQMQGLGDQALDWAAQELQNRTQLEQDRMDAQSQLKLAGIM